MSLVNHCDDMQTRPMQDQPNQLPSASWESSADDGTVITRDEAPWFWPCGQSRRPEKPPRSATHQC